MDKLYNKIGSTEARGRVIQARVHRRVEPQAKRVFILAIMSSGLEEENRRLQEELQAIKQRMEGMEDMIAKMKTLFA